MRLPEMVRRSGEKRETASERQCRLWLDWSAENAIPHFRCAPDNPPDPTILRPADEGEKTTRFLSLHSRRFSPGPAYTWASCAHISVIIFQ